MKYVSVRHMVGQKQVYWFSVPEELDDMVSVGTEVMCDTKYGLSSGAIVSILDGVPQKEAEKTIGDFFPLKSLIGVYTDYLMRFIRIPIEFALTKPDPQKLKKRIEEYYLNGGFKTVVVFSSDGTLVDGYTAYLVAKMFGLSSLAGIYTTKSTEQLLIRGEKNKKSNPARGI